MILPIEGLVVFSIIKTVISLQQSNSSLVGHELLLPALPYWLLVTLFSVFHFVVDDFARFAQHLLMHKVPLLWSLHKVHHSANQLTPITLYRVHVGELLLASARRVATTTITTMVLALTTHHLLSPFEILGVTALSFAFNLLGSNLRHSPVPIRFGWLENIFISPYLHQLHHSAEAEHHDKNFGVSLSVWDRVFGSYLNIETKELKFGLSQLERIHDMKIISALLHPIAEAIEAAPQLAKKLTPKAAAILLIVCSVSIIGCDNSSGTATPPGIKNVNEDFVAKGVQTQAYNNLHSRLDVAADSLEKGLQNCSTDFAEEQGQVDLDLSLIKLRRLVSDASQAFHRLEPLMWEIDLVNAPRNLMRDKIYSWPSGVARCDLDKDVVEFLTPDHQYRVSNINTKRGLDAIQYLIYAPLQHSCFENADLDQWNELSRATKLRQRCELSQRLAVVLKENVETERVLFEQRIENEPAGKILQLYYESLVLFVDRRLKDRKLGTPSGQHERSCPFVSCPYTGENRVSQLGIEALIWNYEGLLQIYTASAKPNRNDQTTGFFGLMHTKGFAELGNQIFDLLSEGKTELESFKNQSIQELAELQTEENCMPEDEEIEAAPLCSAHKVSKQLSDLFKVDFKTALLLENTKPAEGDGD